MKLRNFIPTAQELPPTNLYVLGYWRDCEAPFLVARRDEDGIWWSSDPEMRDDYVPPTSWSHLPGGLDFNTEGFHGKFKPDLDAEV
ncbi:MAG: hypothetical protein E6Q97_33920 [Desulfurellales bacterium]|nr:MAG: hypothetical protein E6Q97_33920 [Desulfurellales bacterium]